MREALKTTFDDVEATVQAIRMVNEDIRNYFWMANQISAIEAEQPTAAIAGYGDEAAMPKAPYTVSDPTYRQVKANMRKEERKNRYLDKVQRLENAVASLDDERERMVIEGCMDRISFKEIGLSLSVSRQAAFEIKERVVRKLAVEMYLGPA